MLWFGWLVLLLPFADECSIRLGRVWNVNGFWPSSEYDSILSVLFFSAYAIISTGYYAVSRR